MIATFKTWLARHRNYKQTIRELKSLTEHELRDLGLNESMILGLAREAAYGVKQ